MSAETLKMRRKRLTDDVIIYKANKFPGEAFGPVTILFLPRKCTGDKIAIWIFAHPLFYNELAAESPVKYIHWINFYFQFLICYMIEDCRCIENEWLRTFGHRWYSVHHSLPSYSNRMQYTGDTRAYQIRAWQESRSRGCGGKAASRSAHRQQIQCVTCHIHMQTLLAFENQSQLP